MLSSRAVNLRSFIVCSSFVTVLFPTAALAQTTRDDGIKAFVRGDYVEAARILAPLAEDAQSGDQTARLLVGMLNDSGYAGQGGTLRACASYGAAAATPGPFTQAATVLARMIREELGNGSRFCEDERFLKGPVTFRNGAAVASAATDGFTALARGEVDSAAALLKNLAESDSSSDQVAQFLMGTMYQGGRGAPLDPLRACALYHRASIVDGTPFSAAATRLMKGLWREHDNEWFARCQALGNLGLDHGFEPVIYDLGSGRSITWDFAGAKLTNQGKTTDFPWRGPRGAAYLPLRHTTLRSGAAQVRRDFIEMLFWSPSGDRWTLSWLLFEVSGDSVRHIADQSDLQTRDVRPGATDAPELRALVDLRVNNAGMVEWSVPGRPGIRGTVESEEERQQHRAEEAAEAAAMARVDWTRTFDVSRIPVLRFDRTEGCGHVLVAAFSADRAEAISVHADRETLNLVTAPRTIDLARERAVSVSVHVYDRPMRSPVFCTDVGFPRSDEVWRAVSGRITIELSEPGVSAREPHLYRATIRIDGAEFVSPSGQRTRQSAPIVITALVGQMFG